LLAGGGQFCGAVGRSGIPRESATRAPGSPHMNESSEVAGEHEQLRAEQAAAAAEILRMLDEVAAAFSDAFPAARRFVPVRISVPAQWPRQLLN
jgi:hypothetical protein